MYRAEVLADAMQRRNLGDSDLAEVAEIDRSTVYRIRTGRVTPTLPVAIRIAQALDIDLSDFTDQEGEDLWNTPWNTPTSNP